MSGTPVESVIGFIDECRPDHEVGNVDGNPIVLPGDRLFVRGWALARDGSAFATELEIGDSSIPLRRTIARSDLPATNGDPSGFEIAVEIPQPTRGLNVPIALVAVGEIRRTVGLVRRVVPARELAPSDEPIPSMRTPYGRFRTIADADPSHPRHGWGGRRSMRWNSAIAARGWILDAELRPPSRVWLVVEGDGARFRVEANLTGDGEATAVAGGAVWFEAGFACALAPWTLEPGLYTITAVHEGSDGAQARGPTEAFQVVDDDDRGEPALFLPVGATISAGGADVGPLSVVRGSPVVVRGSAIDPTTGRPAAIFVRFDDSRPLPVPAVPNEPSRFGGIADTEVLSPGVHRLQVLLQPAYPGYWHLIAERRITVAARP